MEKVSFSRIFVVFGSQLDNPQTSPHPNKEFAGEFLLVFFEALEWAYGSKFPKTVFVTAVKFKELDLNKFSSIKIQIK